MRLRDWRSPIEGLDMGPQPAAGSTRSGVMATHGIPPKGLEGFGHTHGEAHKERERAKWAAAKAARA